jgi:L-alanine-DL-glutamate epimerase-like enolase superfamily enzyme
MDCEAAQILQTDASKAGGITGTKEIANLAVAFRRPFAPHTSMSGINSAATLALLATCANALIYKASLSALNTLRDVGSPPCADRPGRLRRAVRGSRPRVEVDESVFARYPGIPGRCYVQPRPGPVGSIHRLVSCSFSPSRSWRSEGERGVVRRADRIGRLP